MAESEPTISARLLPAEQLAQPGGRLKYTVLNTGGRTVSFGTPFRLELMTESGWQALRSGSTFSLMLYRLAPGHARELRAQLPPRLGAGTYRLVKEIRSYPPSRSRRNPDERAEVSFEFEVGDRAEPPPPGKLV